MKIDPCADLNDELRPEYTEADMKNSVRGKYADRLRQNLTLIALEPDVALVFSTQEEVNTALRALISAMPKTALKTSA